MEGTDHKPHKSTIDRW